MAWAKCAECSWEAYDLPSGTGTTAWRNHHDRTHGGEETVHQLPGVTFHEQALLAIRSLAAIDPAHDWPRATNEAKRLGWIERVSYGQSIVEGTNRSAVAVWRGTYAATRRAVA